jgi:DNA modification methylase
MPAKSVHCAVTSPPYWGLRDYGIDPVIWGGARHCAHEWGAEQRGKHKDMLPASESCSQGRVGIDERQGVGPPTGGRFCEKCGSWRGCLGLEPTPELYIEHLVEVFRELRRVLRDDGTVWLNLGDSYSGIGGQGKQDGGPVGPTAAEGRAQRKRAPGLKPKDLVGLPWMVAFALRADDWWLRAEIIWHKPNAMPESCTDRPTRAHETVFLLSKQAQYFYDSEAVREANESGPSDLRKMEEGLERVGGKHKGFVDPLSKASSTTRIGQLRSVGSGNGRNKRTVWTIATASYPQAHFATFPPALVEPCIKAGTSDKGCCATCGAPWRRVSEKRRVRTRPGLDSKSYDRTTGEIIDDGVAKPWRDRVEIGNRDPGRHVTEFNTLGWAPTCKCDYRESIPCTVLDPFAGSGTAVMVARRLGRHAIGLEASAEYCRMARERIVEDAPLLNG